MSEQNIKIVSVNEELQEAYRATNYNVLGSASFTLRIGVESPEIANLYRNYDVTTAAFLTACNPFSTPTPEHENDLNQQQLEERLHELSVGFLTGMGEDPSGEWAGEPSVLALGISREAAVSLGNEFRQNAIVWIGEDRSPELIFLYK
jgi:hypothetical protein